MARRNIRLVAPGKLEKSWDAADHKHDQQALRPRLLKKAWLGWVGPAQIKLSVNQFVVVLVGP